MTRNSTPHSAVGIAIQDGPAGMGLVPSKVQEPVWAELIDKAPEDGPAHYFQWKQVYKDDEGKWHRYEDESGFDAGLGSLLVPTEGSPYKELLFNPAVEINDYAAPIGIIVRLIPSLVFTHEDGTVHRLWYFSFHKLRPFRLIFPLIPTGPVFNEQTAMPSSEVRPERPMIEGDRDTTVEADWLDVDRTRHDLPEHRQVTLYARHENGWPSGDQYLSLGLGVAQGTLSDGTRGWAEYVPQATIIGTDINDDPIWRGEWQIVSLDALMIVFGIMDQTLQPGEIGTMKIVPTIPWLGPGPSTFYYLQVFNNLNVPMTIGSFHNVHFNRALYAWLPVTPLATAHGLSVYVSGTVDAITDGEWVIVPMADKIEDYGVELTLSGKGITNSGEMANIGQVSWTVTARRLQPLAPPDIDSRLQVALFNNGGMVVGSLSEITSSRRIAAGEGANAVNSASGSIIQVLGPKETLDVRIRKQGSAGIRDSWRTIQAACHLTFATVTSTYLRP